MSDEEDIKLSGNTKNLRSRVVSVNETDPALQAQVDLSRWNTKAKNITETDLRENPVEMEKVKTSDMAEKPLIVSAESRGAEKTQQSELEEMRQTMSQMQAAQKVELDAYEKERQ